MTTFRAALRLLLVCVLAWAAGAQLNHVLNDAFHDDRVPAPRTVHRLATVKVDGPDKDIARDDTLVLSRPAQAIVHQAQTAPGSLDVAGDLRGPDPQPAGVLEGPLAAQEWPGCRTAFVRNFSSRHGNTPRLIWLHYTAGPELPGWADLIGLTAYSNNPSSQVSWHISIDREGHCFYNVPLQYKAWTEAGANSTGIGIEVNGRGNEPDYAGSGIVKLAEVVGRISRLEHIPLRLGAVSNCSPTRSGIVTHWMGGPCSGGHQDIKPYDLNKVIARIIALQPGAVTHVDVVTCRKLNWWRTHGRPHGLAERRAVRRHHALAGRHVTCTAAGPVRA